MKIIEALSLLFIIFISLVLSISCAYFYFFRHYVQILAFILVQNNDYFLTIFHILCKRFQFIEGYEEKKAEVLSVFLSENPSAFHSSICNLSPISSFLLSYVSLCCLSFHQFRLDHTGRVHIRLFNQTCKELHAHHRNHLRLIVNSRKTWFTDSCIF